MVKKVKNSKDALKELKKMKKGETLIWDERIEMKPITFFRKELDIILDFLLKISKPKYLTKEGQKEVDKLLIALGIISKEYFKQLVEDKTEE